MSTLNQLTVLGSGVLGGQIAWHSAFKGKTVVVYDIAEEPLERSKLAIDSYAEIYRADLGATVADIDATHQRLTYTTDLASAVAEADLVIEAVPEAPSIKLALYTSLAPLLPERTIIATNTSTLLPSDFAADTGRPEKFLTLHFANQIWKMNLTEIMVHDGTSRDTIAQAVEFAIEIGMVPIPLRKEQNGYVLNSWLVPLLNAAQTLVTNGIATPEDIDRTYLLGGAKLGPMGWYDVIGMTTAHNVLAYWGEKNGDAQMLANAKYIKERFVDKGDLGLLSGKGYYEYPSPAYQSPDFLSVPDIEAAPQIAALVGAASTGPR
ncbi:3-hydroxyacyl-CoA dehydrogenase [Promicromonospora thailandica]|uniref:3-hydroxybutyryl-CoA dehydrogenase n=1 Tax=Promicromonospora thailandica TaxID=765201 RepID=A0A9X2G3U8_9MICO|nr:3-hydroxyacyl-CoA dehydrogenase [Promicromonospora thailandica]MCP2265003.1 3-hydroxybutyryl-CoA dehydrogenase [Promicromonospora thailandica]BFF18710.1 3-hydroxyacyl-CoA dehydrogenase [Promicromonospora thailandica]